METITPETHAHVSESPSDDEDLGRRRIWEDGDEQHLPSRKGKHNQNGFADAHRESSEETELEAPDSGLYPPTTDEEAETRRIEENLRRWQINEMQKRKAARESISKPSQTAPDVGWRTSSLWQKSNHRQRELGKHTALGSQDSIEHLPLDTLVATPGPSPSPSPLPSPLPSNLDEYPNNPFANPPISPFEDPQQVTAVMSSSEPPANVPALTVVTPTPERPTLLAKSTSFSRPPPPKPINLPPPKTPPPPVDVPPPAVSPLSLDGASRQPQQPEREIRWWHEWLCGCGEDRDADNQGGRTNPFE
ncbi:hypothetical protein J3R30DRAFT_3306049 [Lentinula aciculospora]|uniref:Uncharacterized protein n=1 Tax=Lentinula aciculospora TaxID=153920 RepID=A0A9W8ZVQ4_9AGAR|nr:hypothetical protein J3R30DRAFT_3306049 [Lentinula aciculospora]